MKRINQVRIAWWLLACLVCSSIVANAQDRLLTVDAIGWGDFERYGIERKLNDGEIKQYEIGNKIVYFYQRRVDSAIVEGDFLNYQFDKATGKFLKKKVHWRNDLPSHLPIDLIPQDDIEYFAKDEDGEEIMNVSLYFISAESYVFPFKPTPKNPCWVVSSVVQGVTIVEVFDAVTGEYLGEGVPPPAGGFSLSGPMYWSPCSSTWTAWYQNAAYWFDKMGFPTDTAVWPTQAQVQSYIQNPDISLFYELAHGGSTSFASGCVGGSSAELTTAAEVEAWIASYREMPFTFLGSCDGMCSTGSGTLSYAFRKGSSEGTATVGYCGMSGACCVTNCWYAGYTIPWQTALFNYMSQGWTMIEAFDQADADYPGCSTACDVGYGGCMRFAGDENFIVSNAPWPMFRANALNSGLNDLSGPTIPVLHWSYLTGDDLESSPAIVASGSIYVGSKDNALFAFSPTGTLEWIYRTGGGIFSSPATDASGTVYVGSGDSNIYAVSSYGSLKWTYETGGPVDSSPGVKEGLVYVGGSDDNTYVLTSAGSLTWSYLQGDDEISSPAISASGEVYIGALDNRLYAYTSAGALYWSYLTGDDVSSSPSVDASGIAYVGSEDNNLYAFGYAGALFWSYLTGGALESSPAIGATGGVYIGGSDNNIYALTSTGVFAWSYLQGDSEPSSPAVDGNEQIYIGSLDNIIYSYDSDGTFTWSYLTGEGVYSSPAIGYQRVSIGSRDNNLYVLADPTNTPTPTPTRTPTPTITPTPTETPTPTPT